MLSESIVFNPIIGTGNVDTGISDGSVMLELAIGIIGFGIDSFNITFVGDTREFMTGFDTGLNDSIEDT